jgi:hypothetical protein
MRSEQMPVRPERGLGFEACHGTAPRSLPGERQVENEGTTGALSWAQAGQKVAHDPVRREPKNPAGST